MQWGKVGLAVVVLNLSVYSIIAEHQFAFTWTQILIAILIFILGYAEYKEEKMISGMFAMALGAILILLLFGTFFVIRA
ncbi:hypothetical protein M3182_00335 [Mesobacillus maritimus]|uniref:hypothetical protein n=1 Tax=Mesobacillus maritimus TaxID=1643336 RepID=UPI0020424009|nr:hypothetical protein [Mesobacillus maritimus]MCM3584197.1 hypothetical protein [Mesobacillus maritimus]MCM3669341.1 hypothetical protein [Mesobacillus maritimus]